MTIANHFCSYESPSDEAGLPGFEFLHEAMAYNDRLQAPDLMKAAAVLASVVYHAATRPEMLPRKPLPRPALVSPAVETSHRR